MTPIPLGILDFPTAAGSYDLLETQVLSSSASSVTFTGLGSYSDYKHLQIRYTLRGVDNAANLDLIQWTFNGTVGGSDYAYHRLRGYNSTVSSSASSSQSLMYSGIFPDDGQDGGIFGAGVADILDFSSSSKNKTLRVFDGSWFTSFPNVYLSSGLYNDTTPVTSITMASDKSGWVAGSRISLYGVK